MRRQIENQIFDEERALYHLVDAEVKNCTFAGPADGESALKESHNVAVFDCKFSLRYPFWHTTDFTICRVSMDEGTRAPLWYAARGDIQETTVEGVKCLRECEDIRFSNCTLLSEEFGWRCRRIALTDSTVKAQYLFFDCRDLSLERVTMSGKYSFQYVDGMTIRDSVLDTKDAFWHAKNITVYDSVVKGEYLGWYSENLRLVRCRIEGTQPLCYCKGLILEDCTMEGTDLAFEYSDVEATVNGHILSVKNPRSGTIVADSVGEIILDSDVMEIEGKVILRGDAQ